MSERLLSISSRASAHAPSRQMVRGLALCAGAWLLSANACTNREELELPGPDISAVQLGGGTTIFDTTENAFGHPARNLAAVDKQRFFVGNGLFRESWEAAPGAELRDGLGPVYNARSCSSCHLRDGRSSPFNEDGTIGRAMLFRLSVPGAGTPQSGAAPEPTYGGQLQPDGIAGVDGEGRVSVQFVEVSGTFADGTSYTLRKPTYTFEDLAYGPLASGALHSPRVGSHLIGLGLLEAIPEAELRAKADPDDRDGDGISGRVNEVWDIATQRAVVGRFGWKAEQPTVAQQTAGALLGDMGLTSPLHTAQDCTTAQIACAEAPDGTADGDEAELGRDAFDALVFYTRVLAVPARRDPDDPIATRGEAVFAEIGCDGCHSPQWTTGASDIEALSGQTIRPYTDLLLHDMGEGLADGRPSYLASGREWRTPPLWGIGLVRAVNKHTFFLHDGRARSLEEAILWHGGEGESSRDAYRALPRADRAALLAFLNTL